MASIQSGACEHLHFEDRDEVGWLVGPISLTPPHDEEKRTGRREEEEGVDADRQTVG